MENHFKRLGKIKSGKNRDPGWQMFTQLIFDVVS
jgi:hypothetical protein